MKGPGRSPSTGSEAVPAAIDASPASPHRASLPGGVAAFDASAGLELVALPSAALPSVD